MFCCTMQTEPNGISKISNLTSVATSVGILRKVLNKRGGGGVAQDSDFSGVSRRISLNLNVGISENVPGDGKRWVIRDLEHHILRIALWAVICVCVLRFFIA